MWSAAPFVVPDARRGAIDPGRGARGALAWRERPTRPPATTPPPHHAADDDLLVPRPARRDRRPLAGAPVPRAGRPGVRHRAVDRERPGRARRAPPARDERRTRAAHHRALPQGLVAP